MEGTGRTRAPAARGALRCPRASRGLPGRSGGRLELEPAESRQGAGARGAAAAGVSGHRAEGCTAAQPGPKPRRPRTTPGDLGALSSLDPHHSPGTTAAGPNLRAAGGAGAERTAVAGQRGAADATGGRAGALRRLEGEAQGRREQAQRCRGWADPRGQAPGRGTWSSGLRSPPAAAPPLGSPVAGRGVLGGRAAPESAFLHPDHHLRPAETWSRSRGTCRKKLSLLRQLELLRCVWKGSAPWFLPSPHHRPHTPRGNPSVPAFPHPGVHSS